MNLSHYKKQNEYALGLLGRDTLSDRGRFLVLDNFNGLGVEVKGTGIHGLDEKRKKNFSQFPTPLWVTGLVKKLLMIPRDASVLDNSCGPGRFFWHLDRPELCCGVEIEKASYEISKRLFPEAQIIRGNLIEYVWPCRFDYVTINPPFGIWLTDQKGLFACTHYAGRILSQVAALEAAIRSVKSYGYVACITTVGFIDTEPADKIRKWIGTGARSDIIARIELPKDTHAGSTYPCELLLIYKSEMYRYNNMVSAFQYKLENKYDIEDLLDEFREHECVKKIREYSYKRETNELKIVVEKKESDDEIEIPEVFDDSNTATFHAVSGKAVISGESERSKLIIERAKAQIKHSINRSYFGRDEEQISNYFRLDDAIKDSGDPSKVRAIATMLRCGLDIKVTPQSKRVLKKKARAFKLNNTPFLQFVQDGDKWVKINENNCLMTNYPEEIHRLECEIEKLSFDEPWISNLYGYQSQDAARLSLKRAAIDAAPQGTGKTRKSGLWFRLKKSKSCLIVVPAHLINEWKREFKKIGIGSESYKVIKKLKDLSEIRPFNLISITTVRQKLWEEKLTQEEIDDGKKPRFILFADKIGKQFPCVILDEAHMISHKTTLQSKAIARLKPKHWLFLTGTPISNTIKNIYNLLDVLFVAGSPLFPYTSSTFRHQFVTVEWVSREFDDTLDKGRTSQQLPQCKDPEGFKKLMAPKWLRRHKEEPGVINYVQIPKPIFEEYEIVPDSKHMALYQVYLENFAEIFKRYLDEEFDYNCREKTITGGMILAQLQQLEYVSTIPQDPKITEQTEHEVEITLKQDKILELVDGYRDKKIIVFTRRQNFCSFMKNKFGYGEIFNGQIGIAKRNNVLDEFRDGDLSLLWATINVAEVGLNIPQGQIVIFGDPDWKYSKLEQGFCRVLRPDTKGTPKVIFVRNKGMIDEYLWQHAQHKKHANAEVLDHQTFKAESWVHWKDFTYRMLRELNLLDGKYDKYFSYEEAS